MNFIILGGRTGRAPEIRLTATGKKMAILSLATSKRVGDETKTLWHRVILWDKQADVCEKWVGKGDSIFVQGEINYSEYQDSDGKARRSTEIIARNIELVGNNKHNTPKERMDTEEVPF